MNPCLLFVPTLIATALWGFSERRRGRGLPPSLALTLGSVGCLITTIALSVALVD